MLTKTTTSNLLLLLFLGTVQLLSAQNFYLTEFSVRSEAASVIVQWEVQNENDLSEFQLYRKVNEMGQFELIQAQSCDGLLKYSFRDDDVFKNERKIIFYKILVSRNGTEYEFYASLNHNPTAIQRTWGSIKAMFN